MKPLEVGKLYSCSGYYLMLYPGKKAAAEANYANATAASASSAATTAAYWSKRFDKPVSYCDPKTPLLVLSVNDKYHEVLAGDQKGWIINEDWLEIKEIISKAA
jgi:hypothetical protein